jgi:hypothetical protein
VVPGRYRLDPAQSSPAKIVLVVVVVMVVVVVVVVVLVVMMVMMMMILVVVMMVIVSEFHVWVGSRLVVATRGRVYEAQKRSSIRDRIKQFAK